uniref:Uncharacterized protein n=1 Tax=Arundo donax TaxID=35708 RepID=A0A0A9ECY6_ARUDO
MRNMLIFEQLVKYCPYYRNLCSTAPRNTRGLHSFAASETQTGFGTTLQASVLISWVHSVPLSAIKPHCISNIKVIQGQ